jgi:hypothetical protein
MIKIAGDGHGDVLPGETKTIVMPFTVPDTLPSTNGGLIDCRYRIDIVAEIDFAPDIEIQFPLNVFMPMIDWAGMIGDISEYIVHVEPCMVVDMSPCGSYEQPAGWAQPGQVIGVGGPPLAQGP